MRKKLYTAPMLSLLLVFPSFANVAQADEMIQKDDSPNEIGVHNGDVKTELQNNGVDQDKETVSNVPESAQEPEMVEQGVSEQMDSTLEENEIHNVSDSNGQLEKDEPQEQPSEADAEETVSSPPVSPSENKTEIMKTSEALPKSQITEVDQKQISEGNMKYYLDQNGNLIYSEQYSGNKVIRIQEYYQNSNMGNKDNTIKYIFNLNQDGYVTTASKLSEGKQKVISQYEYYAGAVYGKHGQSIQYSFELNDAGYVEKASKHEKGTQRILNRYEYYQQTVYGSHGNNIQYIFEQNGSGSITKASRHEKGTQRVLNRYEYYPGTVYGNHGKNIQYMFELNNSGYVQKASKLEKGTQRVLNRYEYYPGTVYGKHGKNIQYAFELNNSGYVQKASRHEKGTQRVLIRYEYYSGTVYGNHGKNIQYVFELNRTGNVVKSSRHEKGTQQIDTHYEYYPETVYGKHGKYIKYVFNLNKTGAIASANLREKGTQRLLTTYEYFPNTLYGNHGTKINKIKMNVPLVSQLPELPTGCEITAVTMMLQYKGISVDKVKLAREMLKHPWDPSKGYVGDPFTTKGWTIYPSALTGLVKKYAGNAEILTGKSQSFIQGNLSKNKPIVVWVSPMHGFSVHALVLTGYDQLNYFFNDPWTGEKDVKISKNEFNRIWSNQGKKAISY